MGGRNFGDKSGCGAHQRCAGGAAGEPAVARRRRGAVDALDRVVVAVQAKVAELNLHNNYRLRVKDLSYAEKIKEVEDKFQDELTADKARYDRLTGDKTDMEAAYDQQIANFEARETREVRLACALGGASIAAACFSAVCVCVTCCWWRVHRVSLRSWRRCTRQRSPQKWTATTT